MLIRTLALKTMLALLPLILAAQTKISLKAAGATFPAPIYLKWIAACQGKNPSVEINYDAIGSEAGIRELLDGKVDFGASDNPRILSELAAQGDKYLLFPSVIGAVVPIVNLPGFAGDLAFTPEILADIYLGKIKKWNDPILKGANPRVRLPDLDIVVVHRADGSGTSFIWSDFLSEASSVWKSQVGASSNPKWLTGRPASGNDGVAKLVKEMGGSIGYVEFIYALQNHLSLGRVKNQDGKFVSADLDSIAGAAAHSFEPGGELRTSLLNAAGPEAYPIASYTWFIVPAHIEDENKRQAIKGFLEWMLGPGQRQAAALGYVALPERVIRAESAALARID